MTTLKTADGREVNAITTGTIGDKAYEVHPAEGVTYVLTADDIVGQVNTIADALESGQTVKATLRGFGIRTCRSQFNRTGKDWNRTQYDVKSGVGQSQYVKGDVTVTISSPYRTVGDVVKASKKRTKAVIIIGRTATITRG